MAKERHPIRWLIWSLAAIFYFYEYVLRVAPSVIVGDLMAAFNTSAAMIGLLSSAYFWFYAPMQMPAGILMDRWGARNLLTTGTLACGLGALLFAVAFEYWVGFSARALMGFGSAFAFVGMIYVTSHWFPSRYTNILIGFGNSIGMLGAMWGEAILGYLDQIFDWRVVTLLLAIFGLLLALGIFILFKKYPGPASHQDDRADDFATIWTNLKRILTSGQSWITATVSFTIYLTTVTFAGLWAPSFFQVVYGYDQGRAGLTASMIYLGWVVGGPIVGWMSTHWVERKWLLFSCGLLAALLLSTVLYSTTLPAIFVLILLFFVGALSSAQLLTYSHAILIHSDEAKGSSIAFTNFCVMAVGALSQPFVGWLLDLRAEKVVGAPALLTAPDFQFAATLFPISFVLAALFALFMKREKALSQ